MQKVFDFIKNYHILRLGIFFVPLLFIIFFIIIPFEKSKKAKREKIEQIAYDEFHPKWYDKAFRWIGGLEYRANEAETNGKKMDKLESEIKSDTLFEIIIFVIWFILFFIFDLRLRIFG